MTFEDINIWVVQLHNILLALMHEEILLKLGRRIGQVVELDRGENCAFLGCFAKIRIFVMHVRDLNVKHAYGIWLRASTRVGGGRGNRGSGKKSDGTRIEADSHDDSEQQETQTLINLESGGKSIVINEIHSKEGHATVWNADQIKEHACVNDGVADTEIPPLADKKIPNQFWPAMQCSGSTETVLVSDGLNSSQENPIETNQWKRRAGEKSKEVTGVSESHSATWDKRALLVDHGTLTHEYTSPIKKRAKSREKSLDSIDIESVVASQPYRSL